MSEFICQPKLKSGISASTTFDAVQVTPVPADLVRETRPDPFFSVPSMVIGTLTSDFETKAGDHVSITF